MLEELHYKITTLGKEIEEAWRYLWPGCQEKQDRNTWKGNGKGRVLAGQGKSRGDSFNHEKTQAVPCNVEETKGRVYKLCGFIWYCTGGKGSIRGKRNPWYPWVPGKWTGTFENTRTFKWRAWQCICISYHTFRCRRDRGMRLGKYAPPDVPAVGR